MSKTVKVKVIGAGGIGSYLIEPLARYLSHSEDRAEITVIDGDKYEDRNRTRQRFSALRNKAEETVEKLRDEFPKIHFRYVDEFLTEDNIVQNVRNKDVVLVCVDNHKTRKLISDRCEELDDVTAVSGGNDYHDGNVMVHIRKNGENVTKPFTQLHRSIADPKDENPGEREERSGCQQEVESAPQLLFTNLAIASMMLNVFRQCEQGKVNFNQVFVDIDALKSRPA